MVAISSRSWQIRGCMHRSSGSGGPVECAREQQRGVSTIILGQIAAAAHSEWPLFRRATPCPRHSGNVAAVCDVPR
jgi:hypothetical protein